MKKYIKILSYTVMILFVVFIIIYLYPRKMSREYSGVIYRLGDSNYSETIKVSVNGYYSKGLFNDDKFDGIVTIGDKQLPKINMRFDNAGRGLLFYFDESTGEYTSYGDMFSNNRMNKFTICVFEEDEQRIGGKSWFGKNGLMISAPADNRVEALEISNNLMRDVLTNGELK